MRQFVRLSCALGIAVGGATILLTAQSEPSNATEASRARTIELVFQGARDARLWRTLNGCGPAVTSTPLPVRAKDGTSVTRRAYTGCHANGDVVAYEIEGGWHRWPPHLFDDRNEALARQENGISSQNLNASEVIWEFFAAHPRR